MKIKWYGTASLLLESGGTRLLIDPYLKQYNPFLPPLSIEEARSADAILITHPHLDHFADLDVFSEGIDVYTLPCGIANAEKNGMSTNSFRPVAADEEIKIGSFTVHTYRSRHCVFDAETVLRVLFAPRTWKRAKDAVALLRCSRRFRIGKGEILAFRIADGEKSVMILGSAGMDKTERYPGGDDLLVFPYQGRGRMHRYMVPFLKAFRPKAVMADHFDDAFPPLTHRESMKKFIPTVKKILPDACAWVPEEGIWYEI